MVNFLAIWMLYRFQTWTDVWSTCQNLYIYRYVIKHTLVFYWPILDKFLGYFCWLIWYNLLLGLSFVDDFMLISELINRNYFSFLYFVQWLMNLKQTNCLYEIYCVRRWNYATCCYCFCVRRWLLCNRFIQISVECLYRNNNLRCNCEIFSYLIATLYRSKLFIAFFVESLEF